MSSLALVPLVLGAYAVALPVTAASAAALSPIDVDCDFGGDTPIISGTVGDTIAVTFTGPCSFTLSGDTGAATWSDGSTQDPLSVGNGDTVFSFTLTALGSLRLLDTGGMTGSTDVRIIVTNLGSYNCSSGPDVARTFNGSVGQTFSVYLVGSCAISSATAGAYSWVDDAGNENPALIVNRIATVTLALSGSAAWLAASPNVPSSGGTLTVSTTASGGSTPGPSGAANSSGPAPMTVSVLQRDGQCPIGWVKAGWEAWAQAPVCLLTSSYESGRWSAGTYAEALLAIDSWNQARSS